MIKVGETATETRVITEEMIYNYAEISGDKNPIHLDEEYAKKSIFNTRIAHGMLVAATISKVIGINLPGEGTIYLQQSLKFLKPVFIGDSITTKITVLDINVEKAHILLRTECFNQKGLLVISGEALVKNRKVIGI